MRMKNSPAHVKSDNTQRVSSVRRTRRRFRANRDFHDGDLNNMTFDSLRTINGFDPVVVLCCVVVQRDTQTEKSSKSHPQRRARRLHAAFTCVHVSSCVMRPVRTVRIRKERSNTNVDSSSATCRTEALGDLATDDQM